MKRTRSVRPTAVAGTFYPADPDTLRNLVRESFAAAEHRHADPVPPKALVVPHAGLVYSGPIAASAYLRLLPGREAIRRVVLIGPSHYVPLTGMAVTSADAFATPLGLVPIDDTARQLALAAPGVRVDDRAHAAEHSLEVQLPFLQSVLENFELLPVVAGHCPPDEVAGLLDALWGGPETVVVVSTDLSHYHRYADAVLLDRQTAARITALDPSGIGARDACGAFPLRGLLAAAHSRDMTVDVLDLRNSGDTGGERERVVGYGAFAVS